MLEDGKTRTLVQLSLALISWIMNIKQKKRIMKLKMMKQNLSHQQFC